MSDVNKPFVCSCGCRAFTKVLPFNANCCELQTDPQTLPLIIKCENCSGLYKQTEDWTWAEADEDDLMGGTDDSGRGSIDENK